MGRYSDMGLSELSSLSQELEMVLVFLEEEDYETAYSSVQSAIETLNSLDEEGGGDD